MSDTAGNFGFLAAHDPLFLQLGRAAERAFVPDPATTVIKLRQLAEAFAKHAAAACGLYSSPNAGQLDLLRGLEANGVVEGRTRELFHAIRLAGNRATHDFTADHRIAMDQLRLARELAVWFHRTFGDAKARGFKAPAFVQPEDPDARRLAAEQEVERLRAELAERAEKLRIKEELAAAEAEARAEAEVAAARAEAERAEWEGLAVTFEKDLAESNERFEALQQQKSAEVAAAPEKAEKQQAVAVAAAVAEAETDPDEAVTRLLIDGQLRAAGWEVDSALLRYRAGARPQKGKNRAIAEWPTETGPADYALFVGLTPVGVIEAKRKLKNVPGALEQAKRYAVGLKLGAEHRLAPGARRYVTKDDTHSIARDADPTQIGDPYGWYAREDQGALVTYRVPLCYSTNGRAYHRQRATQSGIWFLDARRPTNLSRPLMGWHQPEHVWRDLQHDADVAAAKLAAEPFDYTELRDYQRRAVQAVESAIVRGQREVLVAMATGTGKTRTVIALIYRLLKSGMARRVLFLVDRTALGEQAENAFKDMRLEHDRPFDKIFDLMDLGDPVPEASTRVHIATVQAMVKRVLESKDPSEQLGVDTYDVVIVDESHRGYNLDREMTQGELELRTVTDYVSMYRRVLDYFDAVKIGLTATPAAHTKDIFGAPVFSYSYREAVVDGHLVDHAPPLRIITELAKKGIQFPKGTQVKVSKPGGAMKVEDMPDDLAFDVAAFNKLVVSQAFTDVVCETLAPYLDPTKPGKTLIYCVTDEHADDVVTALKSALAAQWGEVEDNAVLKITGATDKCLEQIRRYKTDRLPKIAVTVDLLTTGIDVPEICNLVFLRRVNSRILYEQMLGRATRRCDAIGKEMFAIFDAVDLYAALDDVNRMKPVVAQVHTTLETLIAELLDEKAHAVPGTEEDRTHADDVKDQLVTRIRRWVRRMERIDQPSNELKTLADAVAQAADVELASLPDKLNAMTPDEARAFVAARPQLSKLLADFSDRLRGTGDGVYIYEGGDALVAVEHGYGEGQKPEDYLDAFKKHLVENENKLDALKVVLTRPRDLTRAQLKDLQMHLAAASFTEARLRTAWRDAKNEDIAANIIGFIRRQAIGSPLVPYSERVKKAKAKVLAMHPWTPGEKGWLERIAAQLEKEVIVDAQAFETGQFKKKGGYRAIDKHLGGRLKQVLDAFGDAVWDDGEAA